MKYKEQSATLLVAKMKQLVSNLKARVYGYIIPHYTKKVDSTNIDEKYFNSVVLPFISLKEK